MKSIFFLLLTILMSTAGAWAGDEAPTPLSNKTAIELVQTHTNYIWTLVAAALVFFMQAGFAMVETGLTRAKNAINIMIFVNTNLAAGIFNMGGTSLKIIGVQVLGIAACFLWVFPTAFVLFKLIEKSIGLRVSPEEELEGLDFVEHGGNAYPDFEVISFGGMSAPGAPAGAAVSAGYMKASKQIEAV